MDPRYNPRTLLTQHDMLVYTLNLNLCPEWGVWLNR